MKKKIFHQGGIMNIYDFLNSPDVAEHCRNIGHIFNAFECAVIVSKCHTKTFEEKLAAYKAIINQYPDVEMPKTTVSENLIMTGFHEALSFMIMLEEGFLKKFMKPETHTVYTAIWDYTIPNERQNNRHVNLRKDYFITII